MEALVDDGSRRVVASMGRDVVWRRRRVRAWPMPREVGQMKIQGELIVLFLSKMGVS